MANTSINSQGPNPNIGSPDQVVCTVKKLIQLGKSQIALLDAQILCEFVLGFNRLDLYLKSNDAVTLRQYAQFEALVKRRQNGEPIAYLTNQKEFFGHNFYVTPAVLIPRPDTEKLVEVALEMLPTDKSVKVIDVCTGSGCIAISIALARPLAKLIATDISGAALEVAKENARRHGVQDRVEFRQGSWLNPVSHEQQVDLIVANPPYIKRSARSSLMRDVVDFEPHLALFGEGEHGLDGHFKMMSEVRCPMILEIGYDQKSDIEKQFDSVRFIRDDAGHNRLVVLNG